MNNLTTRVATAAAAAATLIGIGVTGAHTASAASHHYTHNTKVKQASCEVFANYPKAGINRTYGWDVKRNHQLGVRYTYGDYALVADYSRATLALHWGFIAKGCLADPHAYDYTFTKKLANGYGVGGNGAVKQVVMPSTHPHGSTIHVTSAGSLRNQPRAFVIGNAHVGDTFTISAAHCGKHSKDTWIYGYDAATGRPGYLEAYHLKACS